MSERQARAEARRRNLELGAGGPTDSYYLEVEREDGVWDVERRWEPPPRGPIRRVWRALWEWGLS